MWQLVMCWGSIWSVHTSLLYLLGFNFLNHRKVLIHILLFLCGSLPAVSTLPCQRRGIVCSHSSELLHTEQEFTIHSLSNFCRVSKVWNFVLFPSLSLTLRVWEAAEPLLTHPAAPNPGLGPRDQTLGVASSCHIYPWLLAGRTDPDFWRLN